MKPTLISFLILIGSCTIKETAKNKNMIDTNRDKEFYSLLADYTVSCMKDSIMTWDSAEFVIEIQTGVVRMSGHYFSNNEKLWLEPCGRISKEIKEYHKQITKDGFSKWNKMIFRLWENKKFETEFIWDSVKQAEIDKYNDEAEKADPNYKRPLWPWEEHK